jgi:formate dehydrogenase
MAVNADEGEPGTFKDRHFLETDPHRVLEGMLMGAYLVEAADVYFYLRDEYPECRHILLPEIASSTGRAAGRASRHLRRGAGAYICGEESAMIESIEGKRGLPRHRRRCPSRSASSAGRPDQQCRDAVLDARPGRARARNGGQARDATAARACTSIRCRASRRSRSQDRPAGVTVRELIDEFCGGMLPGHPFKAYVPGGPSSGICRHRWATSRSISARWSRTAASSARPRS